MTVHDVRDVRQVQVDCLSLEQLEARRQELAEFTRRATDLSLNHDPRWLRVLARGLRHVPFLLHARRDLDTVGLLPLSLLKSILFGRYLVSLPYLNGGGVLAADPLAADALIARAVQLANQLDVRFLELRHESPLPHPQLCQTRSEKVHMRLALPSSAEVLRGQLNAKVRNQVRKGEKQGFIVQWGREDLLADFYQLFSHNMRDLGTPVYSRALFREALRAFAKEAEICVLRLGNNPVAAALLLHSDAATEVPSASSLRKYNSTNANMLMYWHLLCRAVERGKRVFDFGRSTPGSGTYRFKEQWGAKPAPSAWQYHVRRGGINQMRPDNARFGRLIQIWRRLPVPLTRLIGPVIVRGIP